MLGEEPAAYNVLSVGDNGNCTLRRLRWCVDPGDKLQPDVAKRLGDGKNGTTLWRYSDRRYTILTAVALGETMKYGSAFKPRLQRPPDGYNSVSGTEGDLDIQEVEGRMEYAEWEQDMKPLRKNGAKYGLQYVVHHESQINPLFIVRYRRKRKGPPPPEAAARRRARQPGSQWQCLSCSHMNAADEPTCVKLVKQGGSERPCGQVRPK